MIWWKVSGSVTWPEPKILPEEEIGCSSTDHAAREFITLQGLERRADHDDELVVVVTHPETGESVSFTGTLINTWTVFDLERKKASKDE